MGFASHGAQYGKAHKEDNGSPLQALGPQGALSGSFPRIPRVVPAVARRLRGRLRVRARATTRLTSPTPTPLLLPPTPRERARTRPRHGSPHHLPPRRGRSEALRVPDAVEMSLAPSSPPPARLLPGEPRGFSGRQFVEHLGGGGGGVAAAEVACRGVRGARGGDCVRGAGLRGS